MELTLKISLEDEKYDFLNADIQRIAESEEFQLQLKEMMLESCKMQILDKLGGDIDKAISWVFALSQYSWGRNETSVEFTRKLVREAAERYRDQISDTIIASMKEMVLETNVGELIYQILIDGIMRGATGGLQQWADIVRANQTNLANTFNMIRDRLASCNLPLNDIPNAEVYL